MFSGSILAFLWFMCKAGSAEAVHQKQQPEQRAKPVHPASPLATMIHHLLLDLNEVESNNELRPEYYSSKGGGRLISGAVLKSSESLSNCWEWQHAEFSYLSHYINCYSQYCTKEVAKKLKLV